MERTLDCSVYREILSRSRVRQVRTDGIEERVQDLIALQIVEQLAFPT